MNISLLISIFCLVFCLIFSFYIKWYIKRKVSVSDLLAEYRSEVYRLNAEINAVTDRDLTLVENRVKKFKEIMEDADKRVKVYVQELERSRAGEALYTSLGRGIRAALKTQAEIPRQPEREPEMSAQKPNLTLIRQERTPAESVFQPPPATLEPKPPSQRQIHAQIDELVKENISQAEIASRLGISIAEVDLAMILMNNRK